MKEFTGACLQVTTKMATILRSYHRKILDIYFNRILKQLATLPPDIAYRLIGGRSVFQQWDQYIGGIDDPLALINALENIKKHLTITEQEAKAILKLYLKFEERFALECFWIQEDRKTYIYNAFQKESVSKLARHINMYDPKIIVTAHTGGIYAIVELIRNLGRKTAFMLLDATVGDTQKMTPIQKTICNLQAEWQKRLKMIFVNKGNAMSESRNLLKKGYSIVIAPDVTGYANKGMVTRFGGRTKLWFPVGTAKLALEFSPNITTAIPVAKKISAPYTIVINTISTNGLSAHNILQNITDTLVQATENASACWGGWLYLHELCADDRTEQNSKKRDLITYNCE